MGHQSSVATPAALPRLKGSLPGSARWRRLKADHAFTRDVPQSRMLSAAEGHPAVILIHHRMVPLFT
jgi:hypothetical protein